MLPHSVHVMLGSMTVMASERVVVPFVAEMSVVPAARGVSTPVSASIVAAPVFELDHVQVLLPGLLIL